MKNFLQTFFFFEMQTNFSAHSMFASNLFCLFRPCKNFYQHFSCPDVPLQKNYGPFLSIRDALQENVWQILPLSFFINAINLQR